MSLLLTLLENGVKAQEAYRFSGVVKSEKTEEFIPFTNVVLKDANLWCVSNNDGSFVINHVKKGQYVLSVSCMGYQKLEMPLTINGNVLNYQIRLTEKTEDIEEVTVIAEESRQNGTSSLIKKEAVKHLQPSSFADIMELIPGGVSLKNDMTSMKLIYLREPVGVSHGATSSYDFNSSLGTSFVVDGVPLSNDAGIQNVTGSYSSESYIYGRNTTGKGIDMRLIPTDDIESVEVIRGIPSVKYGDLTSGVVDIKRTYRVNPFEARIKTNTTTKLFALGKGYRLGDAEILNANVDYLDFKRDPRNPLINYSRITGSLRFSNIKKEGRKPHDLKLSLDYTGSFDESKRDPDIDKKLDNFLKNNYNQVRLGSTMDWQHLDIDWLEMLSYRISASYTFDRKKIRKAVSGSFTPIFTNREEGEFYGEYLPASYYGNLISENIPVHLYAMVSADLRPVFLGQVHHNMLGVEWEYDKNFGEGEIYDETRPLYAGVGRPRRLSEIPSIQKLSLFAEERINISVGDNVLTLQAGLRGAMAINLSSDYRMSKHVYWDPRTNLSWKFPSFQIMQRNADLKLNVGYGWQTKFPILTHLYPDLTYIDIVQLNYFSQNEDLRQVQYKTTIIDKTNYNLKPNRSEKAEVGFTLHSGKIRMDVGAYYERLNNGFKELNQMNTLHYKLYDVESGPKPENLDAPPTVDMFDYKERKRFTTYSKRGNGACETKKGVEYQLDLGEVDAIHSRVSINGSWMKVEFDLSEPTYRSSSIVIDDEYCPYIGYYTWDKGKTYKQFNTNFRFDTNLKEMGLIFSTSLQCMWFNSWKYNPHDGMPDYYFDMDGNQYPYTKADTEDAILRFLYKEPDPVEFDEQREPIGIDLNLTVSKTIGDHLDLSFYVNRILDYHPDYTQSNGNKVTRKVTPYFGMELKINL